MRILASLKPPGATLPKPPYDGFFECASFLWGGELNLSDSHGLIKPADSKLVRQIDSASTDFINACAQLTAVDIYVLYERMGTAAPVVYLTVHLAQSVLVQIDHEQSAGGAAVPLETLTIRSSSINGTFYDEAGKELGRASFNNK